MDVDDFLNDNSNDDIDMDDASILNLYSNNYTSTGHPIMLY